jgi:uncharacterized protein YciI
MSVRICGLIGPDQERSPKVKHLFVVVRTHGPAWDRRRPLDAQAGWRSHAVFMDALEADGVVVLAGPLEGTDDAMMIMRAADEEEIRTRLAEDPWGDDMLHTSRIARWTLRIGQELLPAGDG